MFKKSIRGLCSYTKHYLMTVLFFDLFRCADADSFIPCSRIASSKIYWWKKKMMRSIYVGRSTEEDDDDKYISSNGNKNNVRWWFISTCCSSVACDLLFIRRKLMTHREERCAWLTHHFCSFYSGGILNFIFKIAVKYFAFSLFFSSRKNRKNFQSYYSRRRRSKQKWISSAAFEKSSVPDNNNGENSQMLFGRQYCYRQSRRITTTITMTMMDVVFGRCKFNDAPLVRMIFHNLRFEKLFVYMNIRSRQLKLYTFSYFYDAFDSRI